METILVTGGSGWIGGFVVQLLLEKGYNVHALYHRSSRTDLLCTWHQADLFDEKEVEVLIDRVRPTHLMHLAWDAIPPQCYTSLRNYNWMQSSKMLIERFVQCGGRRVIVAGSCAEYEWTQGLLSEKASALSTKTLYAICKNSLRAWLESYASQSGLSSGWARIFHLYGPQEQGNRLVSSIIRSLLDGREAACSQGKQYRDFLYVKDVANALVSFLLSKVQGTLNIGSGIPVQVKQIATMVAKELGREPLLRLGALPDPADEPLYVGAHVGRLRQELHWRPQYTLEAGIRETIEWYRSFK
ncbi:NAD(P)-dependent oxidoreductase [Paenibacillus alvei]|uniref:NAD(P)-dependent oxidoreductase n=1 Tax=Paenibacillus alvei TaxID=44250 RepID=A0ABT4GWL9_PAEAL|nr:MULTISPECIES: NAD(P)-dependent oxidoreductase [Paenibacillus]MCY7484491.1 NAD(P)-dependent oxidoreductase [Paenibacillus alvei]MCY9543525.1 NAD(P)-dependent oxidoreductase [Paenibacillus alvei]MCY9706890.1 NAD(P)-dependent oxidoreductase [Paenibacillus alvei]MCY9737626.1 NAD(P)-dependent oxidoreductase [Paenibacillus alvei]MCY9755613.1 NAD(P)-dependent oxidoreductase [Paenibacillus alvei]